MTNTRKVFFDPFSSKEMKSSGGQQNKKLIKKEIKNKISFFCYLVARSFMFERKKNKQSFDVWNYVPNKEPAFLPLKSQSGLITLLTKFV